MASAAIGAVGSVAGGIASGKGAAKAAKIQAQSAAAQTAALQSMYNENVGFMKPTYDNGQLAETQLNSVLGLGGDPTSAQATLAATPGYQFSVDQALKGVNSNAYASGLGNSGAVQKALETEANNLASTNYNTYVGQLGTVADRGVNAENGLVSQGNTTTAAENQETQNASNASAANSVYQGTNLANVLKGLSGSVGSAFGSSYSPTASSTVANAGATSGVVAPTGSYWTGS